MKKSVLYIIFSLFYFPLLSQENLVPNGSFEEYYWCPDHANGYYVTSCKYWSMPTLGSSDYFNACSIEYDSFLNRYLFSVPQNYIGYQYARTGDAYSGLVFVQTEAGAPTNSEYIQVKLNSQLKAGKFYHLQFYVNNSDTLCGNSIGALLTSNELNITNYDIIPMVPQFQSDLNQFFCDTNKWYELNHTFQAVGNENYLTIGVFTYLPEIKLSDYEGNLLIDADVAQYLYIDDVSLAEVDYTSLIKGEIPNIFTPNGDGINDYFMFDNSLIHAKSLTILNRWGNIVFQSSNSFLWDGTYDGKKIAEGVYYYLLDLENDYKINGFLTLMR